MPAPSQLQTVFGKLRAILQKHAPGLLVAQDSSDLYGLEATPGPATLRSWGGTLRRPRIPVAWVAMHKSYVSYHFMGLGHPKVRGTLSKQLGARMQGKTCFNFKTDDAVMFRELDEVTGRGLAAFRKAEFI